MRLHVLSLPHSQTTVEYDTCAFTAKVRKFCNMMTDAGNEVILYAGDENEAQVTEHVTCITRDEQREFGLPGPERVFDASFDTRDIQWQTFQLRARREFAKRGEKGDILCTISGVADAEIAKAKPEVLWVEFGIGYPGSCAPYRIFESYAWMHATYAAQQGGHAEANGRWYDEVIPSYFEESVFPLGKGGDRIGFLGRVTERKGIQVIADIAGRTDLPVLIAGDGERNLLPSNVEFIGHVNPKERADFLGSLRALITPTIYLEPFGSVAVEAQMSGTPAITTDWGAFVETVIPGFTGYRCRTLGEFMWAIDAAATLDRRKIRKHALRNFSTRVIQQRYVDYFDRLSLLHGQGWYDTALREPGR